jgi:hypothetical protein
MEGSLVTLPSCEEERKLNVPEWFVSASPTTPAPMLFKKSLLLIFVLMCAHYTNNLDKNGINLLFLFNIICQHLLM